MAKTDEKRAVVSRPSERSDAPVPEPNQPLGKLERGGSVWSRFGARLIHVLLRPSQFWRDVRREDIPLRELIFPHLLVLIGLRAGAGFAGSLLQGSSFMVGIGELVTSFLSWFAMVGVFAVLAGSFASAKGARLNIVDSARYAAFGLTPLFLVGVFAAIPLPHVAPVAELIAMPWAFYVISAGVMPCLGIASERSAVLAGQMCGTVLILWTIMPTLLPELVKAISGG